MDFDPNMTTQNDEHQINIIKLFELKKKTLKVFNYFNCFTAFNIMSNIIEACTTVAIAAKLTISKTFTVPKTIFDCSMLQIIVISKVRKMIS